MPKLISEITDPALRKLAEERRREQKSKTKRSVDLFIDTDSDRLMEAFEWDETKEGYLFWNEVFDGIFDMTSHPLYPKGEEKTEPNKRWDIVKNLPKSAHSIDMPDPDRFQHLKPVSNEFGKRRMEIYNEEKEEIHEPDEFCYQDENVIFTANKGEYTFKFKKKANADTGNY